MWKCALSHAGIQGDAKPFNQNGAFPMTDADVTAQEAWLRNELFTVQREACTGKLRAFLDQQKAPFMIFVPLCQEGICLGMALVLSNSAPTPFEPLGVQMRQMVLDHAAARLQMQLQHEQGNGEATPTPSYCYKIATDA